MAASDWAIWWGSWRRQALDAFVVFNLAFLALDVFLAHAINAFAHPAQWVPVVFSLVAPVVLGVAVVLGLRGRTTLDTTLGHAVGWLSVGLGVAGMVLHLDSHFFAELTLKSLVYSAPFAAPLAYAGLGLLILLNRMSDAGTGEWSRWVVFLAMGGYFGNFGLSLADHAQNGFFNPMEWVPVVAAAAVVGFLLVAVAAPADRTFLRVSLVVVAVGAAVGLLGAYFHGRAILAEAPGSGMERVLYNAPPFAPLLFVDVGLLAAAGLLDLEMKRERAVTP